MPADASARDAGVDEKATVQRDLMHWRTLPAIRARPFTRIGAAE